MALSGTIAWPAKGESRALRENSTRRPIGAGVRMSAHRLGPAVAATAVWWFPSGRRDVRVEDWVGEHSSSGGTSSAGTVPELPHSMKVVNRRYVRAGCLRRYWTPGDRGVSGVTPLGIVRARMALRASGGPRIGAPRVGRPGEF